MRRPYGGDIGGDFIQEDDPVHVIGHDNPLVQRHARKMGGNGSPAFIHDLTGCGQSYTTVHDIAEYTFPPVGTDGYEVHPC